MSAIVLIAGLSDSISPVRAAVPARAAAAHIVMGQRVVKGRVDASRPGSARAFPVRSRRAATVSSIMIYVAAHNRARRLMIGLYSSRKGHPGSLLTAGSRKALARGRWNRVRIAPVVVRRGRTYWLAVLGRGGTLRLRDRHNGPCRTQSSVRSRVRSLPRSWRHGHRRRSCAISAYARGLAIGGQLGTPGHGGSPAPGPAGPPTGIPLVPPSWWIAPTGSDSNPCSATQPCKTFNHVYHIASPGQVVAVGNGTYPGQSLTNNPAFANGPALVFRGSTPSSVVLNGELLFDGNTHWVEFDNMTVNAGSDSAGLYLNAKSDTVRDSNITFRNLVDIGGLDINSDDNISWIGGSMGPVLNWDPEIKEGYQLTHQPTNILFDGVTFHDCRRSNTSSHVECLHVMNVNGLTIRNSVFYNSEAFDLEFTQSGTGESSNVTLENNWFGSENGYYTVYLGNVNGGLARFNSSFAGWFVESTNDTSTGGDVRNFVVDSNVFPDIPSGLCGQSGTTWQYNVVGSGNACTAGRTGSIRYASDPDVTSSPTALGIAPDFDLLPGSAALGAGNPFSFPTFNIHGLPRARPPNAGAS